MRPFVVLLVACGAVAVHSFVLQREQLTCVPPPTLSFRHQIVLSGSTIASTRLRGSLDYEYIPEEGSSSSSSSSVATYSGTNTCTLASAYPPDTPAGLRGEAVRSALTSGRCIAWDLSENCPQLQQGWIGIEGKGTLDFVNNKLSQTIEPPANTATASFTEACLLSPKGNVVDKVGVVVQSTGEQAYLLTSPGHSSSDLYNRLDPLVFPMDQVTLTEYSRARILTVVSTGLSDVQEALQEYVLPLLVKDINDEEGNDAIRSMFHYNNNNNDASNNAATARVLSNGLAILPHAVLPTCAACGYTLVFFDNHDNDDASKASSSSLSLAQHVWEAMVGEGNPNGPIGIGPLEYETLRIEAGLPAFAKEFGKETAKTRQKAATAAAVAAGPLELHMQSLVNVDKGCYLGQEGVASVLKNPRGPPRLLYSIVFDDENNLYAHDNARHDSNTIDKDDEHNDNLTTLPQVGQDVYVLGSNEEIKVGTITSIAEPSGTGDATIVGLALCKRADSVLKQMKDLDLTVGDSSFREVNPAADNGGLGDGSSNSGMLEPPPLDPLDGLEVIVGGTFTVGKLRMVPSRRYRLGQNMFDESRDAFVPTDEEGSVIGVLNPPPSVMESVQQDEHDVENAVQEAAKAQAEAEAAAAEARRKEEKMELLKKRAQEAMARRRRKKT